MLVKSLRLYCRLVVSSGNVCIYEINNSYITVDSEVYLLALRKFKYGHIDQPDAINNSWLSVCR